VPKGVRHDELQELIEQGAQLVEVLESGQYAMAHLPGAVNIPAWELTADRAERELRHDRPIVVYCFDTL
jgi:ArsR family transcriptional regulator